ncbi:uncharacterized protein LOC128670669 isoform X2 [Plodia interpunctella]|uniref:uncharacterized protein LOC128670669 isoform X2 n=1 Tax=Plodia interpunctella TaxID=58824 RepID=UPI0023689705|nr:uncharacterized protein LOC128670669 isoform X2 [Plodia interpunctella]
MSRLSITISQARITTLHANKKKMYRKTCIRKLDPEDLSSCLFVNRNWRKILENDTHIDWRKVAQKTLPDEGLDMKRNSKLDWVGIVLKSWLWTYHLDRLKVELLHEYKCQQDYWPSMAIYREMYLFDESDHIRLLYDRTSKLKLIGKKSFDDNASCNPDSTIDLVVNVFLLDEDRCYIFEENKYLKVYIWAEQTWQSKWIARFFGTTELNTMAVHRGDVYLLSRHGDMMWKAVEQRRQFRKIRSFNTPPYFNQANSKALLKTILNYNHCYHMQNDVSSIFVKGVTCATYHAGVLFLAYSNGQIEAWILKKLSLQPYYYYPLLPPPVFDSSSSFSRYGEPHLRDTNRLRICDRRQDIACLYDCIYNMAVYEGQSCSYLLVNCGHSIYQYRLTFPGLD